MTAPPTLLTLSPLYATPHVLLPLLLQDFYQLLSRCVSVLHGGPYQEPYTLDSFVAEQQLQDPRLWVDVKALMGDSSDNITGLKGIGEKTAKELVQRLGSVENIMQQLAAMSEEQQKQVDLRSHSMPTVAGFLPACRHDGDNDTKRLHARAKMTAQWLLLVMWQPLHHALRLQKLIIHRAVCLLPLFAA